MSPFLNWKDVFSRYPHSVLQRWDAGKSRLDHLGCVTRAIVISIFSQNRRIRMYPDINVTLTKMQSNQMRHILKRFSNGYNIKIVVYASINWSGELGAPRPQLLGFQQDFRTRVPPPYLIISLLWLPVKQRNYYFAGSPWSCLQSTF